MMNRASSLSGDTLIACHFPLVQLPSWQFPVQALCVSKRPGRLCPAGLTRASSLPEQDSLRRDSALHSTHLSYSSNSLKEERGEEEGGASDSSGRCDSTSSPEEAPERSSSRRKKECSGAIGGQRGGLWSRNSFLPSLDLEEDEEDDDSDGDNLHRYHEGSSFVLHGNSNWTHVARRVAVAPGALDSVWGQEVAMLDPERDRDWLSNQPSQLDLLGMEYQHRHGNRTTAMECGEPGWARHSEHIKDNMPCFNSSFSHGQPRSFTESLSNGQPRSFPESLSNGQLESVSDSSCNSSDGILVNFSTIYNHSNNPATPLDLNPTPPQDLSSPGLQPPHPAHGSVFFSQQPVPQRETLNLQPVPQRETLNLQPVPQRETLNLQPVPQRETFSLQPVPQRETLNLQPVPQRETLNLQPVPQRETFSLQPVPQRETLRPLACSHEVEEEVPSVHRWSPKGMDSNCNLYPPAQDPSKGVYGLDPLTHGVSGPDRLTHGVYGLDPLTQVISGLDPLIQGISGLDQLTQGVSGLDPLTQGVSGQDPLTQGGSGLDPLTQGVSGLDPLTQGVSGLDPLTQGLSSLDASDLSLHSQETLIIGTNQKYYKLVTCDLPSQSPSPASSSLTSCPSPAPPYDHFLLSKGKEGQQKEERMEKEEHQRERRRSCSAQRSSGSDHPWSGSYHTQHDKALCKKPNTDTVQQHSNTTKNVWLQLEGDTAGSRSSLSQTRAAGGTASSQPSVCLELQLQRGREAEEEEEPAAGCSWSSPVVRYSKAQRPTSLPIQPFVLLPKALGSLLDCYLSQKNSTASGSQPGLKCNAKGSRLLPQVQASPLGSQGPLLLEAPSSSDSCSTCSPSPEHFTHRRTWSHSGSANGHNSLEQNHISPRRTWSSPGLTYLSPKHLSRPYTSSPHSGQTQTNTVLNMVSIRPIQTSQTQSSLGKPPSCQHLIQLTPEQTQTSTDPRHPSTTLPQLASSHTQATPPPTSHTHHPHLLVSLCPPTTPQPQDSLAYPSASKDNLLAYPSASVDNLLAYPSASEDNLPAHPSASEDNLLAYPSTSKDNLLAYPSVSKDNLLAYPSASEDNLLAYPSASEDNLLAYPSTSKDNLPAYPSAPAADSGFLTSSLTAALSSEAPRSSLRSLISLAGSGTPQVQDPVGLGRKQNQQNPPSGSLVLSDRPPVEFCLSPDTLYDSLSISHLQRRGLLRAVSMAVELILAHFGRSRDAEEKMRLGNSYWSPSIGGLVLEHLCPTVQSLLEDGLRHHRLDLIIGQRWNHCWSVVEASTQSGPSTRVLHSLVSKISLCPQLSSHTLRLRAFIMGLLNLRALEVWLSLLHSQKDVVTAHYHWWGFLSMSQGCCLPLFQELLLILQPLSALPFDLNLLLEPRLLQNRPLGVTPPPPCCSSLLLTSWPRLKAQRQGGDGPNISQADTLTGLSHEPAQHLQSSVQGSNQQPGTEEQGEAATSTRWRQRQPGHVEGVMEGEESVSWTHTFPGNERGTERRGEEMRGEEERRGEEDRKGEERRGEERWGQRAPGTPPQVQAESPGQGGLRWARLFGAMLAPSSRTQPRR